MLWLSEGDRNSKLFHSIVKICHHKNKVHAIKDSSGTIITDHSRIEKFFLDFYKNLWRSPSNFNVDVLFNAISDDFAVLEDVDRADLIRPISKW